MAVVGEEGRLIDIEEKPARPPEQPRRHRPLPLRQRRAALRHGAHPLGEGANWRSPTSTGRFLAEGRARLVNLGRGTAWLDTGTPDSLLEAGVFVQVLEKRQGVQIACLEEVAYRMGYIDDHGLRELIGHAGSVTEEGRYLVRVLEASI
ncbi:hypothetical protein GCM10018952_10360 [Streptosporangium vulgare]